MSAPYDTNTYHATILRHIDADTTWATVMCPFDMQINLTLRWMGIDAPERFTDQGKHATAKVNEWLPVGSTCLIQTAKSGKEKFGRYLATFFDNDGNNLNQRLIDEGLAHPYDGGPR